ncbi:unnamed protein product [Brassica napus]|uniref:(rape) hypothetical protein n=1 Tax=Brassica napus TaxID=3708 RepID=A0A816IKH6_BRANA|nr:unnamed protein product [Brassica napus]
MNHISIPMYIGLGSYYPRRVMEEVDKTTGRREIPKGKIILVRKRNRKKSIIMRPLRT